MNYPKLAGYFGHRYGGSPLITATGSLDEPLIKKLARFPLMTLEIAPWFSIEGYGRTDAIQLIRRTNPGAKVLKYQLGTHWHLPPTFIPATTDQSWPATWHRGIQRTNGWLYGSNGQLIPGYEVDWSKRETADSQTDLLCAAAASRIFNGLFLDYWTWQLGTAGGAIDPAKAPAMDNARRVNMRRAVLRIREAGGPGYVVLGNGVGEQPWLDGEFREGFPAPLNSFEQVRTWREERRLPEDWIQAGTGITDSTTADAMRAARFALGTACLLGTHCSFGPDRNSAITPYYGTWWFDEYSVNQSGTADTTGASTGWLGDPTATGAQIMPGVWRRDFDGGTVLVNSGVGATVDLGADSRLKRIRGVLDPVTNTGVQERSPTVRARDALFLVRAR